MQRDPPSLSISDRYAHAFLTFCVLLNNVSGKTSFSPSFTFFKRENAGYDVDLPWGRRGAGGVRCGLGDGDFIKISIGSQLKFLFFLYVSRIIQCQ